MKATTALFLDRDGVINAKMAAADYVKSVAEFEFLPGALEALRILSRKYRRIIIITNQQGIYKGLLSLEKLEEIHARMKNLILEWGGRIDGIYYCPHLENTCECRKPKIGLALQAQAEFPDIVFEEAVMVGDADSDIEFGRNLGARTYRIREGFSLLDFARQ